MLTKDASTENHGIKTETRAGEAEPCHFSHSEVKQDVSHNLTPFDQALAQQEDSIGLMKGEEVQLRKLAADLRTFRLDADMAERIPIGVSTTPKKEVNAELSRNNKIWYARILTAFPTGIDGNLAQIEVSIRNGLPQIEMSGFSYSKSKDARIRIAAAIKNSGFKIPSRRITVSVSPPEIKPYVSCFDLPIALGILEASEQIHLENFHAAVGEIGLNGDIKNSTSIFSCLTCLAPHQVKCLLPSQAKDMADILGISCETIGNLRELSNSFNGIKALESRKTSSKSSALKKEHAKIFNQNAHIQRLTASEYGKSSKPLPVLLRGQYAARRALMAAAAGGHHLMMLGSPGSGKSELARLLPELLPELDLPCWQDVLRIYSARGEESQVLNGSGRVPFRCVQPGLTEAQLVGSSAKLLPGEASLAHNGVLFVEEICEQKMALLLRLQQILDEHMARIGVGGQVRFYPADFLLIAAGNPCPCGQLLEKNSRCHCKPYEIRRRMGKFTEAFRQRMDMWVEMSKPEREDFEDSVNGQNNKAIDLNQLRKQIRTAREAQMRRYKFLQKSGFINNSNQGTRSAYLWLNGRMVDYLGQELLCIEKPALEFAEDMANEKNLSLRGYRRYLALCRTFADIEGKEKIDMEHVMEALQYQPRSFDMIRH